MSDPVSSAVINEVVSIGTAFVTGKYSEYKSIKESIDRLEMLLIKIKSAVEVSEAFDINIESSLHEWQKKLKEAVSEADETLGNFKAGILREPNQTIEGESSSHHDATLVLPNPGDAVTDPQVDDLQAKLHLAKTLKQLFCRVFELVHHTTDSPWPAIKEGLSVFARVLDPRKFSLLNPRRMVDKYLENCENVRKLIKTMEKLEKMAGDIGDFLKLLELQSKLEFSRKRSAQRRLQYSKRCKRSQPRRGAKMNIDLLEGSGRCKLEWEDYKLKGNTLECDFFEDTATIDLECEDWEQSVTHGYWTECGPIDLDCEDWERSVTDGYRTEWGPMSTPYRLISSGYVRTASIFVRNVLMSVRIKFSRILKQIGRYGADIRPHLVRFPWNVLRSRKDYPCDKITKKGFFVVFSLKSHINVYFCYGEDQSTVSEDRAGKLWIFAAISLYKATSSLCSKMDVDPLPLFSGFTYVEINIFIIMFILN